MNLEYVVGGVSNSHTCATVHFIRVHTRYQALPPISKTTLLFSGRYVLPVDYIPSKTTLVTFGSCVLLFLVPFKLAFCPVRFPLVGAVVGHLQEVTTTT